MVHIGESCSCFIVGHTDRDLRFGEVLILNASSRCEDDEIGRSSRIRTDTERGLSSTPLPVGLCSHSNSQRTAPEYRTATETRQSPTVSAYEGLLNPYGELSQNCLVGQAGLEPATFSLGGSCSVQLSYKPMQDGIPDRTRTCMVRIRNPLLIL